MRDNKSSKPLCNITQIFNRILIILICIVLFITACGVITTLIFNMIRSIVPAYGTTEVSDIHLQIIGYDLETNYLQLMKDAASDGCEYAFNAGYIYEQQRNLKIQKENLNIEKTNLFSNDLSVDEINTQINELIDPTPSPVMNYIGTYTITYYCSCSKCCGKYANGITASGEKAVEGITVAADTSQLPFGTEIYIEGVGYRTVQDRGGSIKNNRLDVYVDSHASCLEAGKHTANVYKID